MPTFAFKDTDPMSLQATIARLSQYRGDRSAADASNAIMTQTARMGEYRGRRPSPRLPL